MGGGVFVLGSVAARARVFCIAALTSLGCLACAEEPAPETAATPAPWDGLVFLRPTTAGGVDLWLGRVSDALVVPLIETAGGGIQAPR